MKSHDYCIFIEKLMTVMFRGYFKADLWKMFVELSYFYTQICAKQVSKAMMKRLEKQFAVLVCKMETVFPPNGLMQCNICSSISIGKVGLEDLCSSGECIVKKEN
jgi:hypothetical protein